MREGLKKVTIDGSTRIIIADLVINEVIYLEKDIKNGIYNFYFPKDVQNNIYFLACSLPTDVLDGYDCARFNKNAEIVANKLVNTVIPNMDIDYE